MTNTKQTISILFYSIIWNRYNKTFTCKMLPLLLLTAQTFSRHYTFRYAGVPYDLGLRHIHSPEHVQSTHRLGVPLFKIHSASTPLQLTNGTAFVRFKASAMGSQPYNVTMFTSSRDTSCMLFTMDKMCVFTYMKVLPLGTCGHELCVNTTAYFKPGMHPIQMWLQSRLLPLAVLVNDMEDRIHWGHEYVQEHQSLRTYRRMVLFSEK